MRETINYRKMQEDLGLKNEVIIAPEGSVELAQEYSRYTYHRHEHRFQRCKDIHIGRYVVVKRSPKARRGSVWIHKEDLEKMAAYMDKIDELAAAEKTPKQETTPVESPKQQVLDLPQSVSVHFTKEQMSVLTSELNKTAEILGTVLGTVLRETGAIRKALEDIAAAWK